VGLLHYLCFLSIGIARRNVTAILRRFGTVDLVPKQGFIKELHVKEGQEVGRATATDRSHFANQRNGDDVNGSSRALAQHAMLSTTDGAEEAGRSETIASLQIKGLRQELLTEDQRTSKASGCIESFVSTGVS